MRQVLFLGDIVGAPGRKAAMEEASKLAESLGADWVVANAENAAGGSGITATIASELTAAGIHALTLGDHVWGQKGFEKEIGAIPCLCRPANLPEGNPGAPYLLLDHPRGAGRLLVFTVLGRQFMRQHVACPFATADRILKELEGRYDCSLVEIHAEATSEKIALGWHLAGRASIVVGTHTHVATADACVLPGGTAYLTDAGMCGPHEGVIGRSKEAAIGAFLDGIPRRLDVATGDVRLNGFLAELDDAGRATSALRVEWSAPKP
ncbi:MAG: YmdB family metallophosphoesterase [Puniceicoccales bacterium]|jgi:metallophosphoesterase (TIGR00282 family)|nr:YmdB family metallophosphoesterase [Puniceicoccales bacterium]